MFDAESRAMLITNATFMGLSGIAVFLRINVRKQKLQPLKADDYLIIAAWVFSAALATTNIIGVPVGGFGVPFDQLGDEKEIAFLKVLFVLQFWYLIAVALVKLSVLCFYGRIFTGIRFPTIIKAMLAVTISWLISFLFATFFQVWPIRCNWDACIRTTNYPAMYILSSVTDIILDIVILCLPATFVMRLNTSRGQKLGLVAVFGLGIFCVVSSATRLAYTVRFKEVDTKGNYPVNFDSYVVDMIMWSGIEACCSTICANLPIFAGVCHTFSSLGGCCSHRKSSREQLRPSDLSEEQTLTNNSLGVETVDSYPKSSELMDRDLEMGTTGTHSTMGVEANKPWAYKELPETPSQV
ncbi:hypothetical protein MMC06_005950 [Schaereria dolodes]|nr:hypothetical protein [Schaereria dolodes]